MALDGEAIERLPTHAIARMGVAYVPEDRGVFPGLTVAENLRLGRLAGGEASDVAHAIARFPVLGERLEQDAGALSGGERQMLALGRALLSRPRLLLIDEFSEGLQPNVVQELAAGLGEIAASGVGRAPGRAERPSGAAGQRALLRDGERASSWTKASRETFWRMMSGCGRTWWSRVMGDGC